jgi:hypothetical protein
VSLGDRNVEIFKKLSPADQAAYNHALLGNNLSATFAMSLEAENFSRCGGCTLEAIKQVFKPEQLAATYYNPNDALVNKDEPAAPALVSVVAATQDMPHGHQIRARELRVIQVPEDQVVPNAATAPEEVIGSTVGFPIFQNEQVPIDALVCEPPYCVS